MKNTGLTILATALTLGSFTAVNADFDGNNNGERGERKGYHRFENWSEMGGKFKKMRGKMMERHLEDAPQEIKDLVEKKRNGESLTDEEKTTLKDYAKSLRAERKVKMAERLMENAPENVKTILEKVVNGEEITDEEKETIKTYHKEIREQKKLERQEYRELRKKARSGEELTSEEQAKLDERKAQRIAKLEEMTTSASDEIKAIVAKIKAGEKMSYDEFEMLKDFVKENRQK